MKKTPGPYEQQGFAILNYLGDLWGPEVFQTKDDARNHLAKFWDGKPEWKKFKVIRATGITKAVRGATAEKFTP